MYEGVPIGGVVGYLLAMVEFVVDGWSSGPVHVPAGFFGRLRGATGRPDVGVLIRGCSVHALWMRRRLGVVALDRTCRVIALGVLRPGRRWSQPGAVAVLELPVVVEPPPAGARLTAIRWRP